MVQAGRDEQSEGTTDLPRVVYVCGSRKFNKEIRDAVLRETLLGRIVLFPSLLYVDDDSEHQRHMDENTDLLNYLEIGKMCLADETLVICPNGYIGECTKSKIEFSKSIGIRIRYLEGSLDT